MDSRRVRVVAVLVSLVAAIVGLTGIAGPAGAHGPEATFTPITQEPVAGDLAAKLRVTLIYDNDDDPVDDATVQVTPVDASGAEGTQTVLERAPEPGTYEGSVGVEAPGDWTFKLSSEDPEASLELTVGVPEPVAATVPPTTEAPTTSSPETAAPSSPLDGETEDAPASLDEAAPVEDPDDGSFPWGIAVLVAVVAGGVAMAMAYAMRPRGDGEDADSPTDPNGEASTSG